MKGLKWLFPLNVRCVYGLRKMRYILNTKYCLNVKYLNLNLLMTEWHFFQMSLVLLVSNLLKCLVGI